MPHGFEPRDDGADDLWREGGGVGPEDGEGEEAGYVGVQHGGVEGVWVGDLEEEGVDSAEEGDVCGGYGREGCLGWERGWWREGGEVDAC